MTGVPQSPSPSPPPGPLTPSRVSANRDQSSPPRIQSAHLPLFDRLRTARDIAEAQHLCRGQSLRQQDQERQEQKDLQKKIREVEVRAREPAHRASTLARAQDRDEDTPTMVPVTVAPFLSSIVTVSLVSFIKKRTSFILAAPCQRLDEDPKPACGDGLRPKFFLLGK